MRLFLFHLALRAIQMVYIQMFSLQEWVNSWYGNNFRRRKILISKLLKPTLEIDLESNPSRTEGDKYVQQVHQIYFISNYHFSGTNELRPSVVYWPATRPGCQNRKFTYANNRCIRSRNNQDIIALTVDRLNEYKIVTPTRRGRAINYYITRWRQEVS